MSLTSVAMRVYNSIIGSPVAKPKVSARPSHSVAKTMVAAAALTGCLGQEGPSVIDQLRSEAGVPLIPAADAGADVAVLPRLDGGTVSGPARLDHDVLRRITLRSENGRTFPATGTISAGQVELGGALRPGIPLVLRFGSNSTAINPDNFPGAAAMPAEGCFPGMPEYTAATTEDRTLEDNCPDRTYGDFLHCPGNTNWSIRLYPLTVIIDGLNARGEVIRTLSRIYNAPGSLFGEGDASSPSQFGTTCRSYVNPLEIEIPTSGPDSFIDNGAIRLRANYSLAYDARSVDRNGQYGTGIVFGLHTR